MKEKLNTTSLNIALGLPGLSSVLTDSQLKRVRTVAVVSSGLSLLVGLFAIFCIYNYDHRKKLFRHDLIFFLIICDFIKSFILLLYPIIILIYANLYTYPPMIQTLGWFTQFATEGSDFAIGFFAIHFALLIFKPNWKWKNQKSGNMEGGLYKYRNYIWPTTLLVPAIMASLVFIDYNVIYHVDPSTVNIIIRNTEIAKYFRPRRGGYKPWSAWSYLPAKPVWYKYVLSWGPRYFLILMIIAIYVSIYAYVLRETRKIKEQYHEISNSGQNNEADLENQLPWFKRNVSNPFFKTLNFLGLLITFKLDMIGDDSIESRRSFSIITSYGRNNSQQDSVTVKPIQPLNPIITNNQSNNDDHNEHNVLKSLKSFDFKNATTTGGSGGDESNYPPKEVAITNNNNNNTNEFGLPNTRNSLKNGITEMTENGSTISSMSTHDNDTSSDDIHLQERAQSHLRNDDIEKLDNNEPHTANNTNSNNNANGDKDNVMFQKMDTGEPAANIAELQNQFRKQNYANMKKRRAQIQKNLRAIFIYPFSYILIWTFPIIADISQSHHEVLYGPILWLTYIDTFIRPMSCFVHSFVFIFKEKPWKYSWDKVESKVLMDRYMLRGEIGEDEMDKLCQSSAGKRGWYYRSTWNKKKCWKHQNNPIKLSCWYIGKFFHAIFHLKKPNYYDNCNDDLYWNRYYYLDRGAGYPRSYIGLSSDSGASSNVSTLNNRHPATDNKGSPRSSRHHLETISHNCASHNSSRNSQSHYTNHTQIVTSPEVSVPWHWRLLHNLPMLGGIDLDELNRAVRLRYTNDDDDFVIPGLSFVLNTPGDRKKSTSTATNNTKANIPNNNFNNSSSRISNTKTKNSYLKSDGSGKSSSQAGHHIGNRTSFALNNTQNNKSTAGKSSNQTENSPEVDLLDFLNDPSEF
ncbi:g protein-coupled receptor Gpr1p [Monosporozyma servazzii]